MLSLGTLRVGLAWSEIVVIVVIGISILFLIVIHNCPLEGLGVRDISIGDFLCYACFCPFLIFFDCFLIFDFFLQGKNSKIRASVLRKTRRIDPRTPEGPIP